MTGTSQSFQVNAIEVLVDDETAVDAHLLRELMDCFPDPQPTKPASQTCDAWNELVEAITLSEPTRVSAVS